MNSLLQFKSPHQADVPLYIQVANRLQELIENRSLSPGEKIPPTRELRCSFDVSTITIEAGIRLLVEKNYLVRRPRLGTFINPELDRPVKTAPEVVRRTFRIIFSEIDLNDLYWYIVLTAIESSAKLASADKLFTSLHHEHFTPARFDELTGQCDGLLLCGYTSQQLAAELSLRNIPFAMIGGFNNDAPNTIDIDAVMHDDIHRAYISTRHLLELDHSRICCVAGPTGSRLARDIETGYRSAIRDCDLPEEECCVSTVKCHSIEEGRKAGLKILTGVPRPTAVYACDDRLAVGIAKAALHLGFRLPDDLSIIGGGNQEIGKVISPEITSTPSYPERSAAIAIDKLLGQIHDPDHRKSRTVLQIDDLIIGGSTRIWHPRND